jgi:vacuolar-type H+-ATPase subunit C/Vma6
MELLQKIVNRGYPTEYLLSRIRGRRSYLVKDLRPILYTEAPLEYLSSTRYRGPISDRSVEGIWIHLLEEFKWIYHQMNSELQDIFNPFFQYLELRTLFFCLRYKAGKEDGKMEELLYFSLLSEKIKKILRDSETILSAIEDIEDVFKPLSDEPISFKEIFVEEGLKEVEKRLMNIYLEHVINLKLHPTLKDFFIHMIDLRNIIILYKHIWWNIRVKPYFIKGSRIKESMFRQIIDRGEIFEVSPIIARLTGIKIENPDATSVENSLLKWVTRFLRRAGREPSGIGFILDYLWRCYMEARNLSIILHGKDMGKDVLAGELVQ